jgi:5-hydroxyisourate hydrolase
VISTHVLDTTQGRPAAHVPVELSRREADGTWTLLGTSATDADGRCRDLPAAAGVVRLTFDVSTYNSESFFPEVQVVFTADLDAHYHVPLLLNPYGYSVYRGS